jgi:hypothetical protein
MRVAVIQSSYLPWRGYFDFIAHCDLFVLYDDVQYSKGSWRNRNRLKTAQGARWLTVPVHYRFGARIDEVALASPPGRDWRAEHRDALLHALADAPYFHDALELWEEAAAQRCQQLSPLNEALIRSVCRYFGLTTPIVRSDQFALSGTKTVRLLALLRQAGARTYVSGPSAKAYLDEDLFLEHGIRLEYKRYSYAEYPQLWGPFEGAVSILDLIANCGRAGSALLSSREPHQVAVP